jgi:F-type H+-transporting ATPase subunit b
MRTIIRLAVLSLAIAAPVLAQEHGAEPGGNSLLAPNAGLMFWTLIVFGAFVLIIYKYFYPSLTEMVVAREKALREALDAAKRDRDEAAALLATHKTQLEASRAEAQKIIADGRAVADKMREQVLEDTKKQQDELLARAKRDIEGEKAKAIDDLRREAIDLALKGATKVIEKNLDDATNRKLVDDFLRTVGKGS